MLDELKSKHAELHDLAASFQRLQSFHDELQRCTEGKPFPVANVLAWDSIVALRRLLVIDLSEWVGSMHARLRKYLQGDALKILRTSKRLGNKAASEAIVIIVPVENQDAEDPDEIEGPIRGGLAGIVTNGRRDAIRRLFGEGAAAKGEASEADVSGLAERLAQWAENLAASRNVHAHRFGDRPDRPEHQAVLDLQDLANCFRFCALLMKDLRTLLGENDHLVMPPLEGSRNDAHSRDLVDLITIGTIEFAVQQWTGTAPGTGELRRLRDAYWQKVRA